MGVDWIEPTTKKEIVVADAFEAFATYVLEDDRDHCLGIIERALELNPDACGVGELQGGNDDASIYRIALLASPQHEQEQKKATTSSSSSSFRDGTVVKELLDAFYRHDDSNRRRYGDVLTMDKIQQYLLGMCAKRATSASSTRRRRTRAYTKLGNIMFILSFGPVHGQVRHIDHMDPNLQICCYMSPKCPSTIVYPLQRVYYHVPRNETNDNDNHDHDDIHDSQDDIVEKDGEEYDPCDNNGTDDDDDDDDDDSTTSYDDQNKPKKNTKRTTIRNTKELIEFWEYQQLGQQQQGQQQQPQQQRHGGCSRGSDSVTVPDLVKRILLGYGNEPFQNMWCTKYFDTLWNVAGPNNKNTINTHLRVFGQLYFPVLTKANERKGGNKKGMGMSMDLSMGRRDEPGGGGIGRIIDVPGTTLIAGPENEVHAGPPSQRPRMFLFAIGIPNDDEEEVGEDDDMMRDVYDDNEEFHKGSSESVCGYNEDNNGEVQYNPLTLHLDLCCIFCTILDYIYDDCEGQEMKTTTTIPVEPDDDDSHSNRINQSKQKEAKLFFLHRLIPMICEYPNETYERLIGDEREELRTWLKQLVYEVRTSMTSRTNEPVSYDKRHTTTRIDALFRQAIESPTILYSPDVVGVAAAAGSEAYHRCVSSMSTPAYNNGPTTTSTTSSKKMLRMLKRKEKQMKKQLKKVNQ